MNEMMTALEAMVTRIVQTELAKAAPPDFSFRDQFKAYTDAHRHEYAALVSVGALDMPWFDEAIKAEVADASTTPAVDLSTDAFRIRVIEIMQANTNPPGYTFATKTAFEREISEVVQNNDAIGDWVNDKIADKVGGMDFSVRVS